MSIATLRHPGLSRAVIEYLQSHRIEELFDVLSVAISVNMLKEHSTASSGIPQVKNTKFLLSGRYKYFLNVYCTLYMGYNLWCMVFSLVLVFGFGQGDAAGYDTSLVFGPAVRWKTSLDVTHFSVSFRVVKTLLFRLLKFLFPVSKTYLFCFLSWLLNLNFSQGCSINQTDIQPSIIAFYVYFLLLMVVIQLPITISRVKIAFILIAGIHSHTWLVPLQHN